MNIKEFIKKAPKTELHCHLDGSVRPETVLEIAKMEGVTLPSYDLKKIEELMKIKTSVKDLREYLKKFALPQKVMQSRENIVRITKELLEDVSKENVKYIEIRYAPIYHTEQGLTMEEVIEAVNEGIRIGYQEFGIIANQIITCMRHMSVEENYSVLKVAEKFIGKGVVAIDLAGNEADFPPELHKQIFCEAKGKGLHITVHAGETGEEENIIKSIELLNAERIGHGVCAINDENVVNYLVKKQIPLEMCIKSNLDTKIVNEFRDHPIKYYLNKGVKVTLNIDNGTVSNTTLNQEYFSLIENFNMSKEEVFEIIKNGIEASFATKEQKERLLNELNSLK